jgi:hypothetical protein
MEAKEDFDKHLLMICSGDISEYQLLRSSTVKTYLIKLEDFVRKMEVSNKRSTPMASKVKTVSGKR